MQQFIKAYGLFLILGGLSQLLLWVFGAASGEGFKDAVIISSLWLIPLWWFPTRIRELSAAIALTICILALPGLAYFLVYRQELTQSLMMILFESNQSESQEYLKNYFQWWFIPIFILYLSIPLWLWQSLRPRHLEKSKAIAYSLMTLLLAFGSPLKYGLTGDWGLTVKKINKHLAAIPPFQLLLGYVNYQTQLAEVEHTLLTMNAIKPLGHLREQPKPGPTTIVLVIGESTSRLHMGLYGYPRNTNPELSKIKHELTVFDNVYSPRPNTIESLQQVLTFADQLHPDEYKSKPSLVAMMKQAGYHTIWITNQQTLTGRNTMLTSFAKQADQQFFLNYERRQNAYSFDDKVLNPFAESLKNPHQKKFIVVHLLGTHMKYSYRYPEKFNVFKTSQGLPHPALEEEKVALINSYDNAVRYNDWILSQLISSLKSTQQHSLLVYFSDHGEDVYDTAPYQFQGRNEASPTLPMYSIPFIVWRSGNWFNASRLLVQARTHQQYDNADFIYTMAELAGIRFDGFQPEESLVNSAFWQDNILVGDPHLGKLQPLAGTQQFTFNKLAVWKPGYLAEH
ncbi:phosphoethanolamine transferase CptA [Methylophilus aquaticus]|uniref:Phosphoethanolamine transferase CptA n=1 Tax=Methylophilus aquaticus TaxID=1971610 RepID=A0ABT9JPF4_9PROT|nr:phosphoethanolamine transferase CptA [Methylophilus aquaticus]MDP8566453.1 phosphoethanolamine transferase CptA [Methylophilus aquaticus]